MPTAKRVPVKIGRNPGRIPSIVNETGKPPGARNLDGTPYSGPKSEKGS